MGKHCNIAILLFTDTDDQSELRIDSGKPLAEVRSTRCALAIGELNIRKISLPAQVIQTKTQT
jgi:hypothetical protein